MSIDPTPVANEEQQRQYLTFRVGRDLFGVATRYVREILEFHAITAVPMMPPLVRGVINLRGAVVPIIDLAERFGLGNTELGSRTCIVIVELQDSHEVQLMGALVNSVNAVTEIEPHWLRQAPAFGSRVPPEYIEDLARVDERFLTLLRMEQVLNVDQIASLAGQRNPSRLSLI
ncbi:MULTISPECIES: chemotaxis protein CheW [Pseudomonas]|uniref:Chemotaxis signal transduction protein n=1 Tax=Pseudomonas asplenii TaxID=53407 RepID=A0A0N0E0X8_9PSED|nr:chemotaxis protein CheW [Pseudomonas fuscovaginae]KPA86966.1 chemotaxis signal transduction protein [Pseudomonas fuscovaginae]KPA96608.1 chemotaxis signal transduction protein [Pseudomonas fuscovaginae]